MMITVTSGVVHGKRIELADDPHIPDGQQVEVTIRSLQAEKRSALEEGFRRSAGAWANYPEMDAIMAEIQKERRNSTRPEVSV